MQPERRDIHARFFGELMYHASRHLGENKVPSFIEPEMERFYGNICEQVKVCRA